VEHIADGGYVPRFLTDTALSFSGGHMAKNIRYFHCSFAYQHDGHAISMGDATVMRNRPFNMYDMRRWVNKTNGVTNATLLSWQELTEDEVAEMIEELPTPQVFDQTADKQDGGDDDERPEQESELPKV
jgi:hypothetical protein